MKGVAMRHFPEEMKVKLRLDALTGHGDGEEVGGSTVGAEGYILGQISICFCRYLSGFLHILQATGNHGKDLKRKVT